MPSYSPLTANRLAPFGPKTVRIPLHHMSSSLREPCPFMGGEPAILSLLCRVFAERLRALDCLCPESLCYSFIDASQKKSTLVISKKNVQSCVMIFHGNRN